MGIYEDYCKWPLGRQLQVTFIAASFLLTLVLVILAKFQLDWLKVQITNNTHELLNDNLFNYMHHLGSLEATYLTTEFGHYIAIVENLKKIDEMILGFSSSYVNENPFQTGTPINTLEYSETEIDYTTGCFMSRNTLTAEGTNLELQDSSFDKIYPYFYNNSTFLGLYQGYITDEILHYYPGSLIRNPNYTPIIREWFYKARYSPGEVIITEPYIEAVYNMWVVTASTSVNDIDGNVYGVIAADITLDTLTKKISEVKVLDLGFALLISKGGMVLTVPDAWKNMDSSNILRIYDSDVTGISEDQWNEIKLLGPNDQYYFKDANGTAYILTKNEVTPYENRNNATHYILLCANAAESENPISAIIDNFQNTIQIIFYITLSIGVFAFFAITILIYFSTRKIGKQLKKIENVFSKLIRTGLFPKSTPHISFASLEHDSEGIKDLVDVCKERVETIKDCEVKLNDYNWGETRPADELLFTDWSSRLYPYNSFADAPISWRIILNSLNTDK